MKKIQHDFSHTNISEALKRVKKSKYKRVHQNNFFYYDPADRADPL